MDNVYRTPVFFGLIGITTMVITYATLHQQSISSPTKTTDYNESNDYNESTESSNPFSGVSNPLSGVSNPFSGVSNPFSGDSTQSEIPNNTPNDNKSEFYGGKNKKNKSKKHTNKNKNTKTKSKSKSKLIKK